MTPETKEIIRNKAASEWPDDFEMQVHVVNQQTAAAEAMSTFRSELDLNNPVISSSMQKALSEWPTDFEMQAHVFRAQLDAASEFFDTKHPTMPTETLISIKERAFAEWEDDYEMMLHVLQAQVSAWEELNP